MPEYPDVELDCECLAQRTLGRPLEAIRIASPWLLRSVSPRPSQNEGRVLADRALSRLLKQDWPRTLEEMEQRRPGKPAGS